MRAEFQHNQISLISKMHKAQSNCFLPVLMDISDNFYHRQRKGFIVPLVFTGFTHTALPCETEEIYP